VDRVGHVGHRLGWQPVAGSSCSARIPCDACADAFRKEQRKKEVARNKLERKFTREAVGQRDKPEEIKKQLQEILELEDAGPLNKVQKLRKKVLQDAYDHALKKKKVRAPTARSSVPA
jgi:hypothetical protein